jgi:hypothetical protein
MAYLSGKDCAYVFVDGVDVAVSNNELTITNEAVCPKRRPLGAVSKTAFLTGQVDAEMTIAGWLDTVTSVQLADATGDAKVVSVLFGGNTHSQLFAGLKTAYVTGRKLGMSEDDLDTYEPVLVTSSCKADIGYVVAPYAARTANGSTDASDARRDAAVASSGTAYLHIAALNLNGYTSLTVTVRHSDDGISWGDHTAFTTATAVGAQTLTLATAVKEYLSISWAWVGSGTSPSWSGFVGVAV